MSFIFSTAVALLSFGTVYIACICEYRWYKLLISTMFSAIVTILVSANFGFI